MATLNFSNKGRRDIYLTKEYSSEDSWNANKDHIGFATTINDFKTYLQSSSCGNAATDKIKIRTLPDQGRLFYVTNPLSGTPVYAEVTIGQEIMVSDLLNYNVLRFNAEGVMNDQYTTSYLTTFTFERYCGVIASEETTHISLNMIHVPRDFGEIIISPPESLEMFMRSTGINQSLDPEYNYCGLMFTNSVYINRQGRTGFDIQYGDLAYADNTGNTVFAGAMKVYRVQSAIVPTDDVAYIVQINNSGQISLLNICDAT